MAAEHSVKIARKIIGRGLLESASDGIAEVFAHHEDPMVRPKASKVVLTIEMTPDEDCAITNGFTLTVSRNVVLAPRKAFKTRLYRVRDGSILTAADGDPRQGELRFSDDNARASADNDEADDE